MMTGFFRVGVQAGEAAQINPYEAHKGAGCPLAEL
jgi:hypothetical protein